MRFFFTMFSTSDPNASMNEENGLLRTDELVEFEKWRVQVQDFRKITDQLQRNLENIPLNPKPKDVNMEPVGLGSTRTSTDHA